MAELRGLARANNVLTDLRDPRAPGLRSLSDRLSRYLRFELAKVIEPEVGSPQMLSDDATFQCYEELELVCRDGQQLRFSYSPLRGNTRRVWIEPLEMSWQEGHAYLIAYDLDKAKRLELRVERIVRPIEQLPGRVHPKRSMVQAGMFRLFDPVARAYQPRVGEIVNSDPRYPGALLIETRYVSAFRLCQRLLRYGQYVEILEPPELRQSMVGIIAAMTRRDEGGPG